MQKTFSDLLAQLDDVQDDGRGYVALCPNHSDTHPSLRVMYNPDTRKIGIKCRAGCDTADVIKALGWSWSDLRNVDPGDLSEINTVTTEAAEPDPGSIAALQLYLDRAAWGSRDLSPAVEYAAQRFGIDVETFDRLGLGYDDGTVNPGKLALSSAAYHDAPRLVVPFRRFDGVAHYLQARALEGTPRAKWSGPVNPDGASWGRYGFLASDNGWPEVLVCEGPGDALTAVGAGYDAVAVRGAGLATSALLAEELADGLRGRRVIVVGDADEAGQTFTAELSRALSAQRVAVYTLSLPDGAGDLTEWREQTGAASFPTALIRAVKRAGAVERVKPPSTAPVVFSDDELTADTDADRAELVLRYAEHEGVEIAYSRGLGWLVWKGDVWEVHGRDDGPIRWLAHSLGRIVEAHAREAWKAVAAAVQAEDKEAESQATRYAKSVTACAKSLLSNHGAKQVVDVLTANPQLVARFETFDQQKDALGVRNGIVDLRTGELRPYTKEDRLTRRIDVDYRPGATSPVWDKFIRSVFVKRDRTEDPEYVDFMRRLTGYGITGESRERVFAILYGEHGRNGKSRFLEALKGVFDAVTETTSIATFTEKALGSATPDLVALRYARIVEVSESGEGYKFDEARIKSLSGGDTVKARDLYLPEIEFKPQFIVLLATNHKPNFRGTDDALWSRVRLLPFYAHFPEGSPDEDPRIDEKLAARETQEAILAWAVAGAQDYYSRERNGLAVPDHIKAETIDFRQEQDRYSEFIFTCFDVTNQRTDLVKGTEILRAYEDWAEASSERHPVMRNTLFRRLEKEPGFVRREKQKTTWFQGVRLLDGPAREAKLAKQRHDVARELVEAES